jgi:hypothetical protein
VKTDKRRSAAAAQAAIRQDRPSGLFAALRARAAGPQSLLLALLMLAAFLGQSVATQAHVHFLSGPPLSAATADPNARTGPILSATTAPGNALADCQLCRELAMSGHYVLPGPVPLFEGRLAPFWLAAATVAALACRQRSHRWQSRAPPR